MQQENSAPSDSLTPAMRDGLHWLSLYLRAAFGSLFLIVGISKIPNGVAGTIEYFHSVLEDTMLPAFLVTAHASVIMFVEIILGIWLILGFRLSLAWKVAVVVLLTLAIGMVFAQNYDVAATNYLYGFMAAIGILIARYDRWNLGACR